MKKRMATKTVLRDRETGDRRCEEAQPSGLKVKVRFFCPWLKFDTDVAQGVLSLNPDGP